VTKKHDFNEQMSFSWYEICDDEHKILINTGKLESCIQKYGINTPDKDHIHLHSFLEFMTEEQINMVISNDQFDPQMASRECLFYPGYGSDKRDYVFRVLLEHDVDGRYLHEKVYYLYKKYAETVIDYINRYLIMYYDEHPNSRRMTRINSLEHQKMLLENHGLKRVVLFDMMLPCIDKSDKRSRF